MRNNIPKVSPTDTPESRFTPKKAPTIRQGLSLSLPN